MTRVVAANPAAERLLGYDAGELLGKPVTEITLAEDLERERPLLAELLDGKRDHFVIEKRYIRSDGELLWGRATVSILHAEGGEQRYLIKVVDDVTPERDAETERRAYEEQLRQAQKMEALGRLSGGVAHDFNNLLQVIAGHAQLALAVDPASAREHVREVVEAASRASALTAQLLEFSRKEPFRPVPLDLNEVIAQIERMLGRLLGPTIELDTRLAPEPCVLSCERTKLEQIVVNLAVNARDAMAPGGRLTIETRREERDGDDYAVLAVEDTGSGMDASTLERAFDPFFTTKEAGKGTGLGLSTIDGIVAQCGGDIRVESTPGEGTRFEIAFPGAAPGPAEADAAVPPVPAVGGSETVLLVDDDDAVRTLASSFLTTQGYRVIAAGGAADALELFDDDVDVLVTDAVMPEMSGHELARRLRERRPDLPIVYMSGYDPETAATSEREQRTRFLQKPFGLPQLAEAIRSVAA